MNEASFSCNEVYSKSNQMTNHKNKTFQKDTVNEPERDISSWIWHIHTHTRSEEDTEKALQYVSFDKMNTFFI